MAEYRDYYFKDYGDGSRFISGLALPTAPDGVVRGHRFVGCSFNVSNHTFENCVFVDCDMSDEDECEKLHFVDCQFFTCKSFGYFWVLDGAEKMLPQYMRDAFDNVENRDLRMRAKDIAMDLVRPLVEGEYWNRWTENGIRAVYVAHVIEAHMTAYDEYLVKKLESNVPVEECKAKKAKVKKNKPA